MSGWADGPAHWRHGGKQARSYRTDFHQHHKTTSAGRKVLRNDRQEQEQ